MTSGTMNIYILCNARASEALAYAEQKDNYIEECLDSRANARARMGTSYTPAKLSDTEVGAMRTLFDEYRRHMPMRIQRDIDYASIVFLMPSADTGFPHTRPDQLICFPQQATLPSMETFLHELWHVHQRKYPDLWKRLYKNVWKFRPFPLEQIPAELREHMRINPDTMLDGPYCWRDTWVPLPIFQSPTQPRLGDCSIWFYNVGTRLWKKSAPVEWSAYFGNVLPPTAHEHPNELSAYMLSTMSQEQVGAPPAFRDLSASVGAISFRA